MNPQVRLHYIQVEMPETGGLFFKIMGTKEKGRFLIRDLFISSFS
jgi:hypothetical protein